MSRVGLFANFRPYNTASKKQLHEKKPDRKTRKQLPTNQ